MKAPVSTLTNALALTLTCALTLLTLYAFSVLGPWDTARQHRYHASLAAAWFGPAESTVAP